MASSILGKIATLCLIISLMTSVNGAEGDLGLNLQEMVADFDQYSNELRKLEFDQFVLDNLKTYKKRYPKGDSQVYPLNFANLDEIGRALSKAISDTDQLTLETLAKYRKKEELAQKQEDKKQEVEGSPDDPSEQLLSVDIDILNYVIENENTNERLLLGDDTLFSELLTPFSLNSNHYYLFIRFKKEGLYNRLFENEGSNSE
mmetsp:Transcript_8236/g.13786  ORF Transcript_8236/g.13786 Transcript_8236/m.13786 type:complete len:203 (+) Transcript_8236:2-610(+)